jgi:hypothetical protein
MCQISYDYTPPAAGQGVAGEAGADHIDAVPGNLIGDLRVTARSPVHRSPNEGIFGLVSESSQASPRSCRETISTRLCRHAPLMLGRSG